MKNHDRDDRDFQAPPQAMIPVRDLGLHVRVQSLQNLFITLVSSLHPLIIHTHEGQETVENRMSPSVKTSVETAAIQVCNRICDFMADDKNWLEDNQAENILSSLMHQAVAAEMNQKRQPRKKKDTTDEQK
jgi:hypothetical protein